MALAQVAMRGIAHDEKGRALFDTEIVDVHNVGMLQLAKDVGLGQEFFLVAPGKPSTQHFDGNGYMKSQVLAKVDCGSSARTQQAVKTIHFKLLVYAIHCKHT